MPGCGPRSNLSCERDGCGMVTSRFNDIRVRHAPNAAMQSPDGVVTFLFSDIEGSSRLWEQDPERMPAALARHDALVRAAVEANRGRVVKMLGDGVHAAFDDPRDAVRAAVEIQRRLSDPAATNGISLAVRCGLHAGLEERRDNDFFGRAVNRAARIMSVSHGGQILVSQTIATLVGDRLPKEVALRDLGSIRLRGLANAGARPSGPASRVARGIPGVAHARGDAEQPAAAAHVVHRPRAGAGRSRGVARKSIDC